jgi:hypothetical protein
MSEVAPLDMNDSDVEKRVQKIHGSKRPIPISAEIYHDLQIAGDDAAELLNEIVKAYGVSFQGFRFEDYFPDETEALWLFIKCRLGFPDKKRMSFTFGHLIAVVQHRAWFDPATGSRA